MEFCNKPVELLVHKNFPARKVDYESESCLEGGPPQTGEIIVWIIPEDKISCFIKTLTSNNKKFLGPDDIIPELCSRNSKKTLCRGFTGTVFRLNTYRTLGLAHAWFSRRMQTGTVMSPLRISASLLSC